MQRDASQAIPDVAVVYSRSHAGFRNSSCCGAGNTNGRPAAKTPNDAGSTSHLPSAIPPKQFLSLDGVPILIHSLRAFAAVQRVTAIYVAVRKTEMERVQAQVAEYGFADRVHVVEGGDTRQESVLNALAALPAEPDDVVLVHDAVRPLIDTATIDRTIDAVVEHGAAIVGTAGGRHHQAGGTHRAWCTHHLHHSARVHRAGANSPGVPIRAVCKRR